MARIIGLRFPIMWAVNVLQALRELCRLIWVTEIKSLSIILLTVVAVVVEEEVEG